MVGRLLAVPDTGPERVGASPASHAQTADDATRALVLAAWPEPGPPAILSTTPHHEPASDGETFAQGPEDDPDPTPPGRRSQQIHRPRHEAIANQGPDERLDAYGDWDILDWIGVP